ncbi:11967_t:CDS:1, partial [Racocetra fulgida]
MDNVNANKANTDEANTDKADVAKAIAAEADTDIIEDEATVNNIEMNNKADVDEV